MSDSKAVVSSGWSSLSTIDEFDMGINKNKINIITRTEDISKSVAKSLFVESLIDQLCKLLEKDPSKRRRLYLGMCRKLYKMQLIEDTYNIEELAPLRGFYKQALIDALLAPNNRVLTAPPLKYGSSRYATDFEEIGLVGSGGFGKVYKAKNLLDQVTYAVKKIPLKYQNITTFQKKLNEVKALAKLNHANIVQYKAAWLEPYSDIYSLPQSPEETVVSSNDSDIIVFQHNHSHSANISNHASPQENESNMVICKYPSKGTLQRPTTQVNALLYVTMHLCDGTLNEWLRNRNLKDTLVDVSSASHIMLKATKGVQYIHSCNIVHHDIKPSNIFLSSDLKSIEVGDFGLSCLQGYDHSGCPLERGQFGTPLYAAPEQLKGICDSKSDVFSLGLIFIELLTIFKTEMERIKILTEARSGNLPSSIPLPLVPVIKELLSFKPSKRPTAAELIITLQDFYQSELKETALKSDDVEEVEKSNELVVINNTSTSTITDDKDEIIKGKDREISELRQILAERENEIAYLKHLMTQYSS